MTIPREPKYNIEDNLIDINQYVFEIEKDPGSIDIQKIISDTSGTRFMNNASEIAKMEIEETDDDGFGFPKQLVYFTHFYTNYLVNQIDFGFFDGVSERFFDVNILAAAQRRHRGGLHARLRRYLGHRTVGHVRVWMGVARGMAV